MSNLATKAPNFTRENAREMALRSAESRRENIKRENEAFEAGKIAALALMPKGDEARKQTTLTQIDALDKRINEALDDDDEERFLKLTAAKERLWKLVQPTTGVAKPGRSRRPEPPMPSV
jgi:uncharacterized protein YpiB (UPF0302 family)